MKSRKTKFKQKELTVGKLINALSKFPEDTEVLIADDSSARFYRVSAVSDNRDFGGDNECAFLDLGTEAEY